MQRIQLDDQMLLAAHPVVLCPAGVGHESVTLETVNALLTAADPSGAGGAAAQGPQGGLPAGGTQPLVRCAPRSDTRDLDGQLVEHSLWLAHYQPLSTTTTESTMHPAKTMLLPDSD